MIARWILFCVIVKIFFCATVTDDRIRSILNSRIHRETIASFLPKFFSWCTLKIAKSMFEHGVVNQALAGAIRRLIKDYLVLLCQLEHQYRIGQLGIARLQFFLRVSFGFLPATCFYRRLSEYHVSIEPCSFHTTVIFCVMFLPSLTGAFRLD